MIGKVVHYTNIHEAPIPVLLNEDDKLIDTGQISITQKSEDRYFTMVSTVLVTAVPYLGFEYRSVHDGDRRGFTVKPTAKYVDECLDIVQLQNAKAVLTLFTEQKSLNLHDENDSV